MTYLPAPSTGIPAPTSILFPQTEAASDPMFGVNPFSNGNMYSPSTFGIDPSLGLPDLQTRAAQQAQLMQMAQLSSLGLAPDTDPHVWTPEEATRQTDQAIAKIASVNPEAAQRLAEQRAPTEDNGDSFWDNIKEVAGDILAPGLELGGRILDIVGRTANIIPNLAFDAVNGGDFNFFGDIGGALSGNMRHNWNSVFQEMGIEGDGFLGFIRATVGLGLDIATDPLTWLIPAGAGAKAAEAANTTARVAATRASSITERAAAYFGKTGDDLVTHLEQTYDKLMKGGGADIFKAKSADAPEIISGLLAQHVDEGAREVLSDMMLIADRTYRGVRARGLSTWARKGSITMADGSVLQGKELLSSLEQVVKAGSFSGKGLALRGSAEWKQARQLASALGGARLKVNLPFTNLRYISKSLPYSKLATEKTVGFVTRALAGQGGMNRMLSAIGKGEGTWDDLTNWMENGFNAAFEKNPEMVRNLRGRFQNMGSMYYSISEAMGNITYHMDAGARATRTGLAGYMANAERLEAQSAYNRVVREIAYESKGVSGIRRDRQQWLRTAEGTLGVSFRKKGMVATEEQMADMTRFMDWFPSTLDTTDKAAVDAWFWAKPENQGLKLRAAGAEAVPGAMAAGEEGLAAAEAKLARMHETLDRLEPAQQLFLRDTQDMYHNVRVEMAKRDAITGSVSHELNVAGILPPEQATKWQLGSHPVLEQDFYVDMTGDAGRANRVGYNGFGEADLVEHDGIVGIKATRTSGGGRGATGGAAEQRVRARGGDWVIIDERKGAAQSDADWIEELRSGPEGADQAARSSEAARAEATDGVVLPVAGDLDEALTSARMTTEAIQKNRPDASGVMTLRENGDIELTVFKPEDIKAVSDSAQHVVPSEAGYYHRAFTKRAKEWLRGKVPTTERSLLIAEPEVPGYLARQTLGMDLDEADAWVRDWLAKTYGEEAAATLPPGIFNRNMLEVHEEYLSHAGEAVAAEMLGNASRRMVALGDLQPAMFGSTPRSAKYQWMLHPNLVKTLAKKDKKLTAAVMHMHDLDAKRMEEQHSRLSGVSEEFGMFQAQVEEALANGTEVPNRFVQSVRRYGATVADADAKIGEELAGLDTAEATLREHVAAYDAAAEQVATDPAYGHPRSGQPIAVKHNPDGSQTVRGWHYTERQGLPPEGTRGVDMSNNGFHFGDFDTAVTRAKFDIEQSGRTVGWAGDQSSWPTETVTTGGVEHNGVESFDEWVARSAEEGNPVVESLVPVQPDVFYDDVLYPVEATGKFKGLSEGDGMVIEGDQKRGGLGLTFTDSIEGETKRKTLEREALTKEGNTGAAYVNAVEGGSGQSIVVLEPSDVIISRPTERFAEDVAAGKLFRQADGTVSARRTAGSRKLVARDTATEQLESLGARRSELEGLRRSLNTGADDVVRSTTPGRRRALDLPDKMAVGKKYETGRVAGTDKLPITVKHSGQGQFEFRVGDSTLSVQLTPEGDLQVFGTEVAEGMRRQGIATEMYVAASELADKYGGRLVSDNMGSRSPDAEALWQALVRKGYDVAEEEWDAGNQVFVLRHNTLPPTRAVAESGEAVARTAARQAERLGQNMLSAGKRLERLRRQTQLAMGEANKAYAEFHGARAATQPALVRIETAGGMDGLTRLRVPGLEGYAMPHYVAAEFHNAIDQYGAQGLQKAWRTYVMGPWKRWATYRWPGFHVRNFFGAFFNNWLGGVDLPDYVFSWRVNHARDGAMKWANKEIDDATIQRLSLSSHFGNEYKPTYGDVADLVAEQGIGRANTAAVMGIEGGSMAAHEMYSVAGHKNPSAFRRAARNFDGKMREVGASVEDFHRVAAWATGMSATAGDTYGARAFVMMRHGDYSDLTHAEQYIKDVIPFYKWMRTNVPYQLRMLAENPAKLTLVHDKLKRYAFEAQGLDYEKSKLQMPDYMAESLAVPIPSWVPFVGSKDPDALKFAMFDLPYADLYNGLDEYLSSALPIGRNILESYGFKQTLFSGTPLTGEYKPLSGAFNIPGVRDILHVAGLTKRGADGQEYIEDRLQNVLLAWPIFSRFRNFTEASPDRVDARLGGIFSMLGGVGIKQGDYTNAELDFFYNEVQPLLDQYKSLGIKLPTVADFQSGEVGAQVSLFGPQEEVSSPLFGEAA